MSGKGLLFFPSPYPDEILYGVLCRYWIRAGRPSPRSVMEDFYGTRRDSNILMPRYLGRIASLLPASSGMSVEFFLKNATIFPYLSAFSYPKARRRVPWVFIKLPAGQQIPLFFIRDGEIALSPDRLSSLLRRMLERGREKIWGALLAPPAPASRSNGLSGSSQAFNGDDNYYAGGWQILLSG